MSELHVFVIVVIRHKVCSLLVYLVLACACCEVFLIDIQHIIQAITENNCNRRLEKFF